MLTNAACETTLILGRVNFNVIESGARSSERVAGSGKVEGCWNGGWKEETDGATGGGDGGRAGR